MRDKSAPIDLTQHLAARADVLPVELPRAKQRGWRRMARHLESWAAAERADPGLVPGVDRRHAAVRFDRWAPFPLPIRRRMVEHLVGIHDAWHRRIGNEAAPKYVGLWLFLPHVYNSQVVVAFGPNRDWYASRHDVSASPRSISVRAAPPALYHRNPCDLSRFEWTHHVWSDIELLSSFGESDWPSLVREAQRVERLDDGDLRLTFVRHDFWGRLRDGGG